MPDTVVPILKGLATLVLPPSMYNRYTGGSDSSGYCYSTYLRHLVLMSACGQDTNPARVAEIGPGDSIGAGLAALLGGADSYAGLDTKAYEVPERTGRIFDELVELFRTCAPIPDNHQFPRFAPQLASYAFPSDILTPERLTRALSPERVARIRASLQQPEPGAMISYAAPWNDERKARIEHGSLDWIWSQAAMEHVDDLQESYAACAAWLKPGGVMSHAIDFQSHRTSIHWNGHWARSDLTWRAIRGARPWLLNREPLSTHLKLITESGFDVVSVKPAHRSDGLQSTNLAPRYQTMSADDVTTATAFVVAVKRKSN